MTKEVDMRSWALYYARLGWRVFPITPGQKSPPLVKDWPVRASNDTDQITQWWEQYPDANIGLATGSGSGVLALDTDSKPDVDGEQALTAWERSGEGEQLPTTWTFQTGGGGRQRLFRYPQGAKIGNRVGLLPAVDVRGEGGYSVLPPSLHPSGRRYEWLTRPDEVPLETLPFALLCELVEQEGYRPPLEIPEMIPDGQRNNTLYRAACKLRRDGLAEKEIRAAIAAMNEARCDPPLEEAEVTLICSQAAKYAPGELPDSTTAPGVLNVAPMSELRGRELGETHFVVVDLLPQGLSLLASPPKYGKSWFVLDLCLSVAAGRRFLGHETNRCGCLYLALEDSERRVKSRMRMLAGDSPWPEDFYYSVTAPDLDHGLIDQLEMTLAQRPGIGLVVVDTLQKIRGTAARTESAYGYDYRDTSALKKFADGHGILVLLVHHLRKAGDDSDPYNRISGTNGIMGAADTSLVITKAKRSDDNALLSVTGRDVESSEIVIRFDNSAMRWEPLGSAEAVAEQAARESYQNDPLVRTIKDLVERGGGIWKGMMRDLLDAGREIAGVNLADSPRALTPLVQTIEGPLFENDRILHRRVKNGTGAGVHYFRQYDTVEDGDDGTP